MGIWRGQEIAGLDRGECRGLAEGEQVTSPADVVRRGIWGSVCWGGGQHEQAGLPAVLMDDVGMKLRGAPVGGDPWRRKQCHACRGLTFQGQGW